MSFVQAETSYNDTGLAAGCAYSYRFRAMNAARNPGEYLDVANAANFTASERIPQTE